MRSSLANVFRVYSGLGLDHWLDTTIMGGALVGFGLLQSHVISGSVPTPRLGYHPPPSPIRQPTPSVWDLNPPCCVH